MFGCTLFLDEDIALDNKIPILKHSINEVDCLRPELQEPCRPGQKWFCVHDRVRWRKHKCRPHICKCFTQQGELYTRPAQPGDELRKDDNLFHTLHTRKRRDTESHISDIVHDLDMELDEIQVQLSAAKMGLLERVGRAEEGSW